MYTFRITIQPFFTYTDFINVYLEENVKVTFICSKLVFICVLHFLITEILRSRMAKLLEMVFFKK